MIGSVTGYDADVVADQLNVELLEQLGGNDDHLVFGEVHPGTLVHPAAETDDGERVFALEPAFGFGD